MTQVVAYALGIEQQRDALRELNDHATRLLGGLCWMTDDVAELAELLCAALVWCEVEVAMPPDLDG